MSNFNLKNHAKGLVGHCFFLVENGLFVKKKVLNTSEDSGQSTQLLVRTYTSNGDSRVERSDYKDFLLKLGKGYVDYNTIWGI